MYQDISKESQKTYKITKPGDYIFYFENKNGEVIFDILCEKANVYVYGLYRGKENNNFKLHITQNHTSPNSKSQSIVKSVLNDNSKLTFTGTVHIKKEALNSIAHLVNHNLLLNKSASAIANPQLEVYPSEVECTHCAKTIPLPQNQINYLQTRGLSINNAKELLANGFVDEILKIKK